MVRSRAALAALVLALLPLAASAQTGTVRGHVVDAASAAVANINVRLQGTSLGAATGADGRFLIRRVPAGQYTLVATGVGYRPERRLVTVEPGASLTVDLVLSPSNEELDELVVEGQTVNAFTAPSSDFVARLPIADLDNPQVYTTITAELLESQVVTSFDDALTNAPGLFKLWESTGRGGDGAGYYSLRGFAVQPTMVNGLPALTNGALDPAAVDRIEVIKGPSGTLFGSSLISYGGLINVVTKRPYGAFGAEASYQAGSFGQNNLIADVNTPVGEQGAVRAVGAYRTGNSFQDAGFGESFFVAPSLAYDATDRLSFLVQTAYNQAETTNQTMLFLNRGQALQSATLEELGYDPERSYTNNSLTITNPTLALQGQATYEISDTWTSQTALSRSSAETDGYYTYLYEAPTGNPRVFARYGSRQNSTTLGTDLQQNFVGTLALGPVANTLVAGADYFHQRTINNSTGYVGLGTVTVGSDDPGALSRSAVDAALADASVTMSDVEQEVYSAYVSDVADLTPWLSAMASLRVDHFVSDGDVTTEDDDYDQTTVSPKLGLVVQPIADRVSLFANYMNGFQNVAPRVQDDGSTVTFSPEQADQWEVGLKTNLADDRLVATLSYYDITVSDVVRQDPDRVNFFVQDGENYSRGVEASVVANPVEGLDLLVGYSYNESEVVETDNADTLGRRPESAGPQHLGNAWATYRLTSGVLQGLGVGFGGNVASENLVLNRATTGVFTLPAYTVLNASVFYSTDTYRIDLKVNNLADEEYYKGWSTVNPQAPRNVTASFSYRF